ncbi:hypothetical protein G7047_16310 [Diaphorobacter sp. HDW4A]|uniref:hypothetical protein n=1 Tax=Diaphorobacter sp. HDW4A TaxID=2714924 RepID=UPI00140E7D3E|nr:hypothetical protein [Diaphorobacter sp. HDW4A]QIL81300.1 hypothetical protein G7047_16310 [Diaphorobacter sp. HDW4A]
MKQRFASIVFGAAVLSCWAAIWIAQLGTPATESVVLRSLPAAELQGVKRIVFDVPSSHPWRYPRETVVLAGWSGDLRLQTESEGRNAQHLQLVHEGDTVFVRLKGSPDGTAGTPPPTDEVNAEPQIYRPVSLTLPASVSELVWPSVRLMMAASATTPALTVRTFALKVGTEPSQRSHWGDNVDAQIVADIKSDIVPGKLDHLTAILLPRDACESGNRSLNRYEADFEYKGGFFPKITLLTDLSKIAIQTMEPDMLITLRTSPDSVLNVEKIGYLKQIRLETLSFAETKEIAQTKMNDPFSACSSPRMKGR